MRIFWLCLAASGCLSSQSYVCGDRVCPEGDVCAPIPNSKNSATPDLCVTPDALDQCEGVTDGAVCDAGICHDGVCLPSECGNGYLDPGEQCDDHNQQSGDGCSADCTSTETCGNGMRDGVKNEECDDGNLLDGDGCDSKCLVETARWRNVAIDQMPMRTTGTMVYDVARGEMLAFGGYDPASTTVLTDTWRFNGKAWLSADPSTAPAGGAGAVAAYDASRHEVVLFGGIGAGQQIVQTDTYRWNGRDWKLATPHTSPRGLRGAAMVYDSKRHRMVMFGGDYKGVEPGYHVVDDTWIWDGTDWTALDLELPALVPSARMYAAMSYDPLRDQVVLFGGTTATNGDSQTPIAPETWVFDGTAWRLAATTGPTIRFNAKMAWDAVTHTTLMFGGNSAATPGQHSYLAETWSWNGTSWTKLAPTTIPAGRDGQLMASDPSKGLVRMFGGSTAGADPKTWSWNGSTWIDSTPVQAPNGSANATPHDEARGRSVFVYFGATWEFDGLGWSQSASVPDATSDTFGATYDLARHQTIKFGGNTATTASWNGTTWTTLATPTSPSARSDAAMTYDRDRQRTVMFGGADSSTGDALGDTWEWDGASWHELHPAHVPPPRVYAQLAYDPIAKQSVLAGGGGGLSALQDTWTWDGTDWTEVVADAAHTPPGASGAAALWVPRRQSFVSFSGSIITSSASTASTWEWKRGQWNPIEIAGIPPTPRGNAVTLLARDGSLLTWSGVRLLGGDLSAFELGWENASTPEACVAPMDLDGDGLAGCDDPDCYYVCNPTCLPGTTCDATQPHCGDGTCSDLENCRMCPGDCGACPAMCGDTFCDPGETAASCPGDCS